MSLSILKRVRQLIGDTDSTDYWKEDDDILYTLTLAVPLVEIDYSQGYAMSGTTEMSISPTPDEITKTLFALMTAILLLTPDQAKSAREGIYVKDGDTVIDTTKGGDSRDTAVKALEGRYNNLIFKLTTGDGTGTIGYRVDMYPSE